MRRDRGHRRYVVAAQAIVLAAALVGPGGVAAATVAFTLSAPSVSSVAYSDLVTFRGAYTCVNGGDPATNCPTTSNTHTATFALRPSGGATFTTVTTVTTLFVFTSSSLGCPTTCSVPFQVVWRAGRAGTTTIPPGVYDVRLTNTISPAEPILLGGLTIVAEGTETTYGGPVSGLGNTSIALSASVLDHDRGLSPGTSVISPDSNLAGPGLVTFELYDAANTTLVVGPVTAALSPSGATTGSPSLVLPTAGGSFLMRTTFAGNGFYTSSADLDTITVAPSNTPPELEGPAGPIVAEATSAAGAAVTFDVTALDAEDDPDPTPTCDHASGATFVVGDTTVTCSVVDAGGATDSGSFVISVRDTTDPLVGVATIELSGDTGWFNHDSNDAMPGLTVDVATGDLVGVVSLACTDNGADVGSLAATGDSVVLSDGAHVIACVAADAAGNEATSGAEFQVDQTPPTVDATLGPSPSGTGWWNAATGAPTVTFTCDDAQSGVASCPAGSTLGEGVDQTAAGTATDIAGNSTAATVVDIDVDLTAPTDVAFVGGGPVAGGSYYFGFAPAVPSCSAVDSVSGLAGCDVTGYSTLVGTHVLTAVAHDAAGNSTSMTLEYTVLPWTVVGFAKPIDMTGFNDVKGNGSVQLKFEVFAGATKLTAMSVVLGLEQQRISCDLGAAVGSSSTAGTARGAPLKNEASGGGHLTVRWDPPAVPDSCWLVTLRTVDGSSLSALFRLR